MFCVCPPAENSAAGTKRLYDAIFAGCVPAAGLQTQLGTLRVFLSGVPFGGDPKTVHCFQLVAGQVSETKMYQSASDVDTCVRS